MKIKNYETQEMETIFFEGIKNLQQKMVQNLKSWADAQESFKIRCGLSDCSETTSISRENLDIEVKETGITKMPKFPHNHRAIPELDIHLKADMKAGKYVGELPEGWTTDLVGAGFSFFCPSCSKKLEDRKKEREYRNSPEGRAESQRGFARAVFEAMALGDKS